MTTEDARGIGRDGGSAGGGAPERPGPPERSGPPEPPVPTCYRHPDRETYIRCQRCDRPICPDCQRQASVGFQCVECVREGAKSVPTQRTRFGGILRPEGAIVTKVLIGLNILGYLIVQLAGGTNGEVYYRTVLFGGAGGPGGAGVADGEFWRLLSSMFLHTEIWHIVVNMFTLWVLGPALESLLGRARYLALYLVSGLASAAAVYAFTPPMVPVLGASGAIAGLFGATLLMARRLNWDVTWLVGVLVVNVALNVLYRTSLSWQGHLGGLVAGAALGAVLAYAPRERRTLVQIIGYAFVLACAVGLTLWRTTQLA